MIIILGTQAEYYTNCVIDWLINSNVYYLRMETKFEIQLTDRDSYWYRKGNFSIEILKTSFPKYFELEYKKYIEFKVYQLEKLPHIGNYFEAVPNKLEHLEKAKKAGLKIPIFEIVTQKVDLINFQNLHKKIINKSLKDSFAEVIGNKYYYNNTSIIEDSHIEMLGEEFFPTLVQNYIEKKYELRVIFLYEKIWAMALFSQGQKDAEVDWRNYNKEKPIRMVPYYLPKKIEKNILKFAKSARLNTGAIDMILDKKGEFYFLECNPDGQVNMVSEKCNYFIEKTFADFLCQN